MATTQKVINTRLQIRHDSKTNWETNDPVLLIGEMGVENDTRKFKFGDGTNKWSELSYAGVDEEQIQTLIDKAEDNVKVVVPESGESDAEACARAYLVKGSGDDPDEATESKGDMCIVKKSIDSSHNQHTAYVYNGEDWEAMDGNYNAENVYFAEDIDVTTTVGLITNLTNGKATWQCGGKNLKQALQALLAKEEQPNKTNPSANFKTWSLTQAAGDYEAGTHIQGTVSYEIQLNSVGSYTYGPAVAGVSESGTYSLSYSTDNTSGAATTGTLDTKTGTIDYDFYLGDNTKYVKATASSVGYSGASNKAKTNLGNETSVQITAGSASAGTKTSTFNGYRNWFIGGVNDTNTIDSAKIKSLSAKKAGAGLNGTQDFSASSYNSGTIKRMIIAIPNSAGKTVKKVLLKSASNADITTEFKEQTQVSVEGASTGYNTNYRIWVYQPAALDSTEVYTITVG